MNLPGPDDTFEEFGELDEGQETSTLPWPWLLALLAAAAWFPLDSFWQSEDFTALHQALDFRQVLADFGGRQSADTDLWWFSRPFITLSFWLDNQISGADPFLPVFPGERRSTRRSLHASPNRQCTSRSPATGVCTEAHAG